MAEDTKTQKSPQQQESQQDDSGKLPSPQQKYEQHEADRKRLAEEHGNG